MRGDTLSGHGYRHEGLYILIKITLLQGDIIRLGSKICNSLTHG